MINKQKGLVLLLLLIPAAVIGFAFYKYQQRRGTPVVKDSFGYIAALKKAAEDPKNSNKFTSREKKDEILIRIIEFYDSPTLEKVTSRYSYTWNENQFIIRIELFDTNGIIYGLRLYDYDSDSVLDNSVPYVSGDNATFEDRDLWSNAVNSRKQFQEALKLLPQPE